MIWTIGDLHFDSIGEKSMDIFGDNWKNHEAKIIYNWKNTVKQSDLVLLPGDISWALKLNEALSDLDKLERLPGKKFMIKGNHDYWWASNNKLKSLEYDSIFFIHNNSYSYENFSICGTRGWNSKDYEGFDEKDLKIYNRELNRLATSIRAARNLENIICMLHYPPFDYRGKPNDFHDIMVSFNVKCCIYGHLHAEGHKFIREGNIEGIEYICSSSDYIDFKLRKVDI